jgi:hypothetical protein
MTIVERADDMGTFVAVPNAALRHLPNRITFRLVASAHTMEGPEFLTRSRRERAMKARVGDFLVVKGTTTERHDQHAEIIAVRSEDGSPPYVVRWLVTGHEATVYPGSDAVVVTAAEHTEAARRAAARAGHAAT